MLQSAVMKNSDVRLLEDAVASGAALAYLVLNASVHHPDYDEAEPAPKGGITLVLCCAILAFHRILSDPGGYRADTGRSAMLECAMLLAKLGADYQKRPPSEMSGLSLMQRSYRRSGFHGKTAHQLAEVAQEPDLVKAMVMEDFQSEEVMLSAVYCRCGSRLPWKECHLGKSLGEFPICARQRPVD
jgi:hypothetical protein